MINSIGLPNKGLDGYLAVDLPRLAGITTRARSPVASSGAADHERDGVERRRAARAGGGLPAARGDRRDRAERVLPERRDGARHRRRPAPAARWSWSCAHATSKPLIVKLTPNTADVPACALAAEAGRRGRRLADQHPARDGSGPAAQRRPRATVARRRHGRAFGPGRPRGGARPGRGRGGAGRDPGDRDGRGPERARTRASCSRSGRRWWRSAPRASATLPRGAGSRSNSGSVRPIVSNRHTFPQFPDTQPPHPRRDPHQCRVPLMVQQNPCKTSPDRGPASTESDLNSEV